jgi:guanine nucleotide-binding protein subunit beta-2-like 1 protein
VTAIRQIHDHDRLILDAKYAPDGTYFATASWDDTVRVYDTQTWECTRVLQHGTDVNAISWHPFRHELLAGCDEYVHYWNTQARI